MESTTSSSKVDGARDKGVRAELAVDTKDFYNRYLKWLVIPLVIWYTFSTYTATHVKIETSNTENPIKTSIARDSGLRMTMKEFPPFFFLNLHSISGVGLFLCVVLQKLTVQKMVFDSYKTYAPAHRTLGYLCLLLILGMTVGGYLLGGYSAFEGFDIFSIFFALPWILWFIGIYFTAQKFSSTMISIHRLLGNMLLKGCIAVPISRFGGAFLQKIEGWDEVSGFYQGIGGVSFLIFLWQSYEILEWWIRFKKQRDFKNKKAKKTPVQEDGTPFNADAYIKRRISEVDVMVFSKSYCPYCHRAKLLLEESNIEFEAIELDLWEHGAEVQAKLLDLTGQRTVPNIFIGGKHVGGCDTLTEAKKTGKLQQILKERLHHSEWTTKLKEKVEERKKTK